MKSKVWRFVKAFSLIELMVVIAIVAVLAALALPAYQKYVIKAKITKVLKIMDGIMREANMQYLRTGTADTSIIFNGVDVNQNGWAYLPGVDNVFSIEYFSPAHYGTPGFSPGDVFMDAALSGLEGIPGYVAPSGPAYNTGNYSIVAMAYKEIDGIMEYRCGSRDSGLYSIPVEFLPSGCSCANVNGWFFSGTPC